VAGPFAAHLVSIWERLVARRRRKTHERYLAERARQKGLEGQDVEEAMRRVAQQSGASQQGMYGPQ
jgi:hypothetical protein